MSRGHPTASWLSLCTDTHSFLGPTLVCLGGRSPVFVADNRQAHLALLIHVGVVDRSLESDLGRLEGVLAWKADLNPEGAFVVRGVILSTRTGKGSSHLTVRLANGASLYVGCGDLKK